MANAYLMDQLDLGPFADCHQKFALSWTYASQAEKAKSKSRLLAFEHHALMAKLYAVYAGDFERSVAEAEAAVEMAPNEPTTRSSLSFFLSNAGRTAQAIEWASRALRQNHNAAFAMFLAPNLAWTLYLAGRYDEAFDAIKGSETLLPDTTAAIYVRAGRLEEARAIVADWLKRGAFSIATESCLAIKEPMKSAYLDDLRRLGFRRNRGDVPRASSPAPCRRAASGGDPGLGRGGILAPHGAERRGDGARSRSASGGDPAVPHCRNRFLSP